MSATVTMMKLGFLLTATDKMSAVIGNAIKTSTDKLNSFEKNAVAKQYWTKKYILQESK
jgi:hypothetical protein